MLGIGLLGLLQLIIVSVAAVSMLTMINVCGIDLAGIGAGMLARIVFWFLLGYAFFSVLYASMGALVPARSARSARDDPDHVDAPGLLLLADRFQRPELATRPLFSLILPTSPMVMPIRSSVTQVPPGRSPCRSA